MIRYSARNAVERISAAIDRFLTGERLWLYPLATLSVSALILVSAFVLGDYPKLLGGGIAFPDYLAHWTGGRMLLDGNTTHLYEPAVQHAIQAKAVGPSELSWFVSPPFAAPLYAPFAVLGFGASAVLWTVSSLAFFILAVRLMRPLAPMLFKEHSLQVIVIIAATQPVFELFGSGQDSALGLLLWVAGIRLALAKHDASAGVVLALGLFKPQQFMLVPIVFLVQRRFRALGAWASTVAVLAAASVATVGVRGTVDWFRLPFSNYYNHAVQIDQAWKMQSLPALVTTALPGSWSGASSSLGLIVGAALVAIFVRQLIRARRAGLPDVQVWMLTLLATVVVSPHLVIYDLVLVLVPILYLIEHHNTRTVRVGCVFLFFLTWTVPLRHVIAGTSPWPVSLVEAAWTAIPLVVLWVVFARALGLARTPQPIRS